MRRIFVTAIEIIVCFLLQCSVFNHLALASITPNLLIVLTASIGFMRGKKEGLLTGFFCGLLLDIMSAEILGLYALLYMFAGYINGFFHSRFYADNIRMPVTLIIFSDFFINLIIFFGSFLLRGRFAFGFYLLQIIIPELVYTAVVAAALYPVLLLINRRLEKIEKRSAAKFV